MFGAPSSRREWLERSESCLFPFAYIPERGAVQSPEEIRAEPTRHLLHRHGAPSYTWHPHPRRHGRRGRNPGAPVLLEGSEGTHRAAAPHRAIGVEPHVERRQRSPPGTRRALREWVRLRDFFRGCHPHGDVYFVHELGRPVFFPRVVPSVPCPEGRRSLWFSEVKSRWNPLRFRPFNRLRIRLLGSGTLYIPGA